MHYGLHPRDLDDMTRPEMRMFGLHLMELRKRAQGGS